MLNIERDIVELINRQNTGNIVEYVTSYAILT